MKRGPGNEVMDNDVTSQEFVRFDPSIVSPIFASRFCLSHIADLPWYPLAGGVPTPFCFCSRVNVLRVARTRKTSMDHTSNLNWRPC